jgi:crotonobetainyl-CoA:carnitine CoA-transferase CaiB-like acyl-CoA transferase
VSESLLEGVRVVDLSGEPAQMGGRILADLGAEVVKLEPPGGDPLRGIGPFIGERRDAEASLRFAAWNAGKTSVVCREDSPELDELLAGADVVIDTPGFHGSLQVAPARAPQAVWVRVTPFGLSGPRAYWRASDLGVLAASGNMAGTGFPDRAPLRCTEPSGYAHTGPEVALAALAGLASGRPQLIDLSMQETVALANMGAIGDLRSGGEREPRRAGPTILGMKEIWRCKDGWVSFGIRGGVARVPTYQFMTRVLEAEGLATPAWTQRDWPKFNVHDLTPEQRREVEEPMERYLERHSMAELYELAATNSIMLASCNTPRELHQSRQLAARDIFGKLGELDGFPLRFALLESPGEQALPPAARRPAPRLGAGPAPRWTPRRPPAHSAARAPRGAFEGVKIAEFGSGAAGPIAARYFAEHGATVVRVESKSRPEFLRTMALAARSPHGLEGSGIFNALNPGKLSIALNLKHPRGLEVAKRLIHWADLVLENFAPKAMRGFGLDYASLVREKPDLLMVSSCMNGQTGPHRDYPGFGSQGSALSGFTHLTSFPEGPPVGPHGTITDSLAPRFSATAIAAALHYKRRTGRGLHFDVSQVEAAAYTLAPWLLDYSVNGVIGGPLANRSPRTAPHGAFPARGDDAWIAIATWSDAEWAQLASLIGVSDPTLASVEARLARVDEVEALVSEWTRTRTPLEIAERLQTLGIEAVPVQSLTETAADPQLEARGHFELWHHPVLGDYAYERNGFRLSGAPGGYPGPSPTLAQHNSAVLDLLGYGVAEIAELEASGGVE